MNFELNPDAIAVWCEATTKTDPATHDFIMAYGTLPDTMDVECPLCGERTHCVKEISGEWLVVCETCRGVLLMEDSLVNRYLFQARMPKSWHMAWSENEI